MIVSYDSLAEAIYIKVKPGTKVARTVEYAPETFVDLAEDGSLIGIEMLDPSQMVLKKLAKKFHCSDLSRVNTTKLQAAVA